MPLCLLLFGCQKELEICPLFTVRSLTREKLKGKYRQNIRFGWRNLGVCPRRRSRCRMVLCCRNNQYWYCMQKGSDDFRALFIRLMLLGKLQYSPKVKSHCSLWFLFSVSALALPASLMVIIWDFNMAVLLFRHNNTPLCSDSSTQGGRLPVFAGPVHRHGNFYFFASYSFLERTASTMGSPVS